ncbi:hypothetical protein EG850_03175 [Gulosibacter macacae]|uniref:Uncharacterized protein n=1 Tax=Gulosibacter macacae TaxID=2488791 RepID=A0A3P3W2J5_9MICO|nr:hypothetical protein [Gulosibacter macacae]RRJ87869.1 hypothetical protein EG850_03175 [Gulosibacter macacae]
MVETTGSVSSSSASDARSRKFASLSEALSEMNIPFENHTLIRRIVEGCDVIGLYERGGYIKAVRRDGGRDLHIHSGFTNGFESAAIVQALLGEVESFDSQRGWGLVHPENKLREASATPAKAAPIDYGVCDSCFLTLPATGVCDCGG